MALVPLDCEPRLLTSSWVSKKTCLFLPIHVPDEVCTVQLVTHPSVPCSSYGCPLQRSREVFVAELKTALESQPGDPAKRLLPSQAIRLGWRASKFGSLEDAFKIFPDEKSQLSTWVGKDCPEAKNSPLQENDPYAPQHSSCAMTHRVATSNSFLIRWNLCNPARIDSGKEKQIYFSTIGPGRSAGLSGRWHMV